MRKMHMLLKHETGVPSASKRQGCVPCLVAQSAQLFVTPGTAARQAPLPMGLLQAGILEWVAMPSSRGSSHLGIKPRPPHCRRILYHPPGRCKESRRKPPAHEPWELASPVAERIKMSSSHRMGGGGGTEGVLVMFHLPLPLGERKLSLSPAA